MEKQPLLWQLQNPMYQKKNMSYKRTFSSSHDFCHLFENNEVQLDMWYVGTVFKLAWHGKGKHLPWDISHFCFSIFSLCLFLPFKHNSTLQENIKILAQTVSFRIRPFGEPEELKEEESGRNWLNENSFAKGKSILMAQICRVASYANGFTCSHPFLRGARSLSPSSLPSEIPVSPDSCCTTCNVVHFQSVDKTTKTKVT